jgi:hypothetical protein
VSRARTLLGLVLAHERAGVAGVVEWAAEHRPGWATQRCDWCLATTPTLPAEGEAPEVCAACLAQR